MRRPPPHVCDSKHSEDMDDILKWEILLCEIKVGKPPHTEFYELSRLCTNVRLCYMQRLVSKL